MAKRTIDFTITLDDEDNETLEVAAGLLGKSPDEMLVECAGQPVQDFLKRVFRDLREAMRGAKPVVVAAGQARALAREVMKRRAGS